MQKEKNEQFLTSEEMEEMKAAKAKYEELQAKESALKKAMLRKEARAKRERFNAMCKEYFGCSKRELELILAEKSGVKDTVPTPSYDWHDKYLATEREAQRLLNLIHRLGAVWNKPGGNIDWFEDYIYRKEMINEE